MNVAETIAAYRRALAQDGEFLALSRFGVPGRFGPVLGRVTGYRPSHVVLDVEQGERIVILLAEDVAACGFPLPFVTGQDRIGWQDMELVVRSVDDGTRRMQGKLIAYELRVAGA